MSLWSLTLPNLFGYAVVFWLLIDSLAHKFESRDKSRALESGQRQFGHQIEPALRAGGYIHPPTVERLSLSHPSAVVLAHVISEPELAHDTMALDTWISSAIHEQIGSLRARSERLHAAAPACGLLGTILGFLIATWTYSSSHDQGQMMSSVALAMITTLVAGVATLIERSTIDKLDALEDHMVLHAQKTAARARCLFRIRPGDGSAPQTQTIECRPFPETLHSNHRKTATTPGPPQILVNDGKRP